MQDANDYRIQLYESYANNEQWSAARAPSLLNTGQRFIEHAPDETLNTSQPTHICRLKYSLKNYFDPNILKTQGSLYFKHSELHISRKECYTT